MTIEAVLSGAARYAVVCGDNIATLRTMPDACVDSVVCDPPYELGFMGRKWDASGVAYDVERWREVLRVLKPGGHLLAFGGTRTYHRMTCAIEDAGFEIRDSIHWVYGSGFPKSLDVSKAIDSAAGAEREVVGKSSTCVGPSQARNRFMPNTSVDVASINDVTSPATPAAAQWQGWGTALKPAHEPIVVARKPLSGTVAANVQEWGTGALNVDACRVGTDDDLNGGAYSGEGDRSTLFGLGNSGKAFQQPSGRWPSNFVLSHSAGCVRVGVKPVKGSHDTTGVWGSKSSEAVYGGGWQRKTQSDRTVAYTESDGTETVDDWRCVDGCPVKMLGEQSGELTSGGGVKNPVGSTHGFIEGRVSYRKDAGVEHDKSSGTASRFFHQFPADPFIYEAKASRTEREAGCDALPCGIINTNDPPGTKGSKSPRAVAGRLGGAIRNTHPTVKPVALMRWCVRLVTPPGGIVLDPFTGSGSTGCGAVPHGFRFIGCELHAEHVAIANARIAWWVEHPSGPNAASKDEAALERAGQLPLLGGAA